MTHAILDGQWILTHQPIALDPDGRVLDGQHRLQAIVNAGQVDPDVVCEVMVAWESDPATFDVIDTGAARTTADTLRIAGYTNCNVLAAAIRSTLTYQEVKGTTADWNRTMSRKTTADVMEFLADEEQHDQALSALAVGARVSTAVGRHGTNSSLTASALIAYMTPPKIGLGPDTIAEFYERLSDGAMLSSHSPILALRRWLIGDTGFSRVPPAYRRTTAIALVVKAMNDYRLSRERGVYSYRIGIEAMPVHVTRKEVEAHHLEIERALEEREKAEAEKAAGEGKRRAG